MKYKPVIALFAVASALATPVCFALFGVTDKGSWPNSWPEGLEKLRNCSRTLSHRVGDVHEIPFTKREEFESAWPHVLSVKDKGTPLVLVRSSDKRYGQEVRAGVRIVSPGTGELVDPQGARYPPGAESTFPDKKLLRVGPPWPDSVRSDSGGLPEYVVMDDGKWKPCDRSELHGRKAYLVRRARTHIELIVDGEIVDLNRVPLPSDTRVIDKRFGEERNTSFAPPAEWKATVQRGSVGSGVFRDGRGEAFFVPDDQVASMPRGKAVVKMAAPCCAFLQTPGGTVFCIGAPDASREVAFFVVALKEGQTCTLPDAFLEFRKTFTEENRSKRQTGAAAP